MFFPKWLLTSALISACCHPSTAGEILPNPDGNFRIMCIPDEKSWDEYSFMRMHLVILPKEKIIRLYTPLPAMPEHFIQFKMSQGYFITGNYKDPAGPGYNVFIDRYAGLMKYTTTTEPEAKWFECKSLLPY